MKSPIKAALAAAAAILVASVISPAAAADLNVPAVQKVATGIAQPGMSHSQPTSARQRATSLRRPIARTDASTQPQRLAARWPMLLVGIGY
jgi:hypothetical protein